MTDLLLIVLTTDPVETGFTDAGDLVRTYGALLIILLVNALAIWLGVKYLTTGFRKA